MEDKTKVYVFAKKEVFTIFFIMIVTSFVSFLLGVKVGGEFAMNDSGINSQMMQEMKKVEKPIEFKSQDEELVEKMVEEKAQPKTEETDKYREQIKKKIEEEFKMEDQSFNEPTSMKTADEKMETVASAPKAEAAKEDVVEKEYVKKSEWSGKYTIQLMADKSKLKTEEFARTVTVRGYDPIIYDVDIPGRGVYYRVSVGVFDSVSEAKEFVLKNKSFFQGSDYHFMPFE
ncbi:SPOR domain-containing protein [Halobacteriovorax sp. GB3]|uniref:SPOR domain-containing protein n=1 Tax=Halobacteriovorax sp. GB3 TaxID=2719615 RepID=UPI00235EF36D|nr:SPOR domain-containing protein [Halobacteriovorax sp. GB3]MDD0853700.1 SPOR domain-containing protein [Halobacteriovorax sp. GB3]